MAPFPLRRRPPPSCSCVSFVAALLLAAVSAWLGTLLGFFLAKKPYGARAALARPIAAGVRAGGGTAAPRAVAAAAAAAPPPPPLLAALEAAARALAPLRGERIPLMHYTLAMTGHPPIVVRSDVSANGQPDFENFGLPREIAAPHFFAVDAFEGAAPPPAATTDSAFRAVVHAEDTIRDVFVAALLSPGRVRDGAAAPSCKTSPVTLPFACLASLRARAPRAFARDGAPLPAAAGGPLVLDIGHTAGGYYGLLAAAAGVSSLLVDTQPHCTLWSRLAARASDAAALVTAFAAIPVPPAAAGRAAGGGGAAAVAAARVRTGCIGTLTTMPHARAADVDAYYGGAPPERPAAEADGRAAAELARKFQQTEAAPALGDAGGGARVDVPVAGVDDILCAVYGGALCGDGGGEAAAPLILVAKIDARGREAAVLDGMARVLASPALRPRNLLIEVNKNHMAAVLGLPSARAAARAGGAVPGDTSDDALVRGYDTDEIVISDADNAVLADALVAIMTRLMKAGYEVLVSDRGWWAAQVSARARARPCRAARQPAFNTHAPPPPSRRTPGGRRSTST